MDTTCSINVEENESVVSEVLSAVNQLIPSGLDGSNSGSNCSNSSSGSSSSSGSNSSSKISSSSSSSSSKGSKGNQSTTSQWSLVAPSSFDSWSRRGVACPGLTEAQQKVTPLGIAIHCPTYPYTLSHLSL